MGCFDISNLEHTFFSRGLDKKKVIMSRRVQKKDKCRFFSSLLEKCKERGVARHFLKERKKRIMFPGKGKEMSFPS